MENLYKSALYQKYRSVLIVFIDVLIVLLSYVFAYFLDNNFFIDGVSLRMTKGVVIGVLFILIVHIISQVIFRTEKSLWTYTGPTEVVRTFLSSLFSCFMVCLFSSIAGIFHFGLIATAELLAFVCILCVRMAYRLLRRYILDNERTENALIIGAGNGGYLMLREIYGNQKYSYNVVGFLDDYKSKGTILSGKKVLGTIDDVTTVVKEYNVKRIFIAISSISDQEKRRIIDLCASTGVSTKIMRLSLENDQAIHVDDIEVKDLLNRPSIDLKNDEIGSYLTGKVVCVTGAGGSIGSELCRQIVQFVPKKLIMVDVNENTLYMLEQEFLRLKRIGKVSESIEMMSLIISIRERDEMFKLMKDYKPDVVYHAAAHKHVPLMETRPMEAIRNNVFGTKNVIDACIANNVDRFIMISTDKAVNPTNVMGATKRMTELIMQSRETNSGIKMAAVRFGNVLGSNGSVIPIFKEQIKQGGPVTITHRDIKRYFMTIPEASQLVLQAGYYADQREIF
ncbi:MAG: nucleoside-diphosphate sugar epimerase/dehydratase, partial [Porphyromonadaceae bacterium]|nr:nucleoside-diphosphate sugar epimerase/dehydratase [Porphyromonadaceae bacterium]